MKPFFTVIATYHEPGKRIQQKDIKINLKHGYSMKHANNPFQKNFLNKVDMTAKLGVLTQNMKGNKPIYFL